VLSCGAGPNDDAVSQLLLAAFTALGTTGRLDPALWPPANQTGQPLRSLAIDATPVVVEEPRAAQCAFWRRHGFDRVAWNN